MRSLTFIMQLLICSIVVLFFDICLAADTIESVQQALANATQIKKIDLGENELYLVEANEEIVVTASRLTGKKSYYNVTCYDMTGTVLWEKQAYLLDRIFLSKSADKILLAKHDENQDDYAIYTCYDRLGNELWNKNDILTKYAISNNGQYGITMANNFNEGRGEFKVVDMVTGTEIPVNIPQDYSYFYATFLNDHQAVILLQYEYTLTNKEHVKIYDQKIKELYKKAREDSNSDHYQIDMNEYRRLSQEQQKGIEIKHRPVVFLIYDIESRTVSFKKDIITKNGTSLWCLPGWYGNTSVNPAGNIVALKLAFGEITPVNRPLALFVISIQGQELLFDVTTDQIKSLKFVNNEELLVNHGRGANLFSLFNMAQHEKKWFFNLNDAPSGAIRDINVFGNMLSIACYSYMKYGIMNIQLDLTSGEKLGEPLGKHIMYKTINNKSFLADKDAKSITFYNNQGVQNEK